MKKLLVCFAGIALITILVVACGGSSTSTDGESSSRSTVHMNNTNFVQSSITIKKGESITLVNDASVVHIIQNGTWDSSGEPKANQEPGAPTIQAVQIQGGSSQSIGPFTAAGTFQLYCTIHPGMNLTVIVQ